MLSGCSSIASLTVTGDVALVGSGLDDTLASRARTQGMWELADGTWFDCSERLSMRYPLWPRSTSDEVFDDTLTYIWNGDVLGARFEPNDVSWWKLTDEDWRNREKWPAYEAAVDEMLAKTSTQFAPWHIIESNDKKFARVKAIETVIAAIERAVG